jgi:hypothetical protein
VCPLCNQQKTYHPIQVTDLESEVICVCGCTPRLTQT